MFPDIRSVLRENGVVENRTQIRRGWILFYWFLLVLLSGAALYSRFQMSLLGLMPAASLGEVPSLRVYSPPVEPARPLIPVTGVITHPVVQQTFIDDFAMDTGDWVAVEGGVRHQDESLLLTANWLGRGGTVAWNLPPSLVSSAFTFSADLTSAARAWQRFGLVINLQPDGSGLLVMIEPDTGKTAVAWHYSNGLTYLLPWQPSPGVLPSPLPNRVELSCTPERITVRINGLETGSLPPPLPCNQGQVGVFLLTPGLPVSIDNASLDLLAQ